MPGLSCQVRYPSLRSPKYFVSYVSVYPLGNDQTAEPPCSSLHLQRPPARSPCMYVTWMRMMQENERARLTFSFLEFSSWLRKSFREGGDITGLNVAKNRIGHWIWSSYCSSYWKSEHRFKYDGNQVWKDWEWGKNRNKIQIPYPRYLMVWRMKENDGLLSSYCPISIVLQSFKTFIWFQRKPH